jgi:hypothetical protein
MTWERDPLWAKARLYFERAFGESRDDPRFGLWCSLALELLARAALASVSPTLLAEPDAEHRFLLHALNRGSEKVPKKSLGAAKVFSLCHTLFEQFSERDMQVAIALANRRNDELHSGNSAFDEYPSKYWLTAFYRACHSLAKAMGESLESLFGKDEADVAEKILRDTESEVRKHVEDNVSSHRKAFEARPAAEQKAAAEAAEGEGAKLAYERHHRVKCPACSSVATVQGEEYGQAHVTNEGDKIIVRQPVSPRSLTCPACGLKLQGYAELDAMQLGGQYTRTSIESPEDYYGLMSPGSFDPDAIIDQYLEDQAGEYDNE